ncbi:cytochrome P450 alkane hydroxylase-like protein [Venturia nashicola]|nr:cytochrome P450 alkane hydroxylase-like protein [Venturia nashicola]
MHRQYEDLEVFREPIDDLVSIIQESKGVLDLQELFFRMSLDVTTAFLFGESTRSLKAPESAGELTFSDAFNTAQSYIIQRYRLLDLYWLIGGKRFRKACSDVHRFTDQIIDRGIARDRSTNNQGKYVFLDAIAESSKDRSALRGQIINILAAGRDTTACLLSWTFFLLVRHPKVMSKLRAEVSSHDTSNLSRSTLRNMPYLQNVLNETLRLYPSVPVNTRTAIDDTILPTGGGPDRKSPVFIPKGSAIAYSVYSLHRRADLYGMDAEIFRPERWDEEMPKDKNPTNARWGYLPFNGGPRICIGIKQWILH